ncbi:hypothetical protein V8C35DRAFT_302522 [Trichoderma chlorosporum]
MEELFGSQFQSVDKARTAIDALAECLGYNFVNNRVRPNSVELRCSKGRNYNSQKDGSIPAARRRETSSQMTGFPYRLVVGRHHVLSPWIFDVLGVTVPMSIIAQSSPRQHIRGTVTRSLKK